VVLAAGNVQSILLMSGRSGWGAVNKVAVLTFNVVGNLVLIPRIGIFGAAVTWAASMALDTALAMMQVHRFTGVRLAAGRIVSTLLIAAACAAAPAALMTALLGNNNASFLAAVALAGALLIGYCAVDRRRLQIDALLSVGRRQR
jgi:O-antigen/teichoic acid export membrane protein